MNALLLQVLGLFLLMGRMWMKRRYVVFGIILETQG